MTRDNIYALPHARVGEFQFDDTVAAVFPDMISRSVPGYASILSMIEQFTVRYVKPRTHVYDLGCSLGAATILIQKLAPNDAKVIAIDNSSAMVERLRARLCEIEATALNPLCSVEVVESDVTQIELKQASFVVLNWTLQFIASEERESLLSKIYNSLTDGGALLLSEKVRFDDDATQHLLTDLHHDFKRANGYSDLEIAQKRTALENRLIPETIEQHVARLQRAGFRLATPWFQCFNFVSILAVK